MSRGHASSRAVAIVALACLLLASLAPSLEAQGSDIEALWKAEVQAAGTSSPRSARQPAHSRQGRAGSQAVRRHAPVRQRRSARAPAAIGPKRQFTDGRRRAPALSGAPLRRNTPSLWNLAWGKHFFWDGRAPSLEAQVRCRSRRREEMGGDWPTILRRLGEDARPRRPVPRRVPGGAGRIAGDRPQGARSLRALAGVAADPVRCLDRGRRAGAEARRGARLPAVHRQGGMRPVPRRLALHRRPLSRHRPGRQRRRPRARCRAARRA